MPDWITTDALAKLAVFAAAALLIAGLFRRERAQVGQAIVLCALAIAATLAALLCAALGVAVFARLNEFVALLLIGLAFVNLALAATFGTLSALVRLDPPRILRDLTKAAVYFALTLYLLGTHHVDLTSIVATSALSSRSTTPRPSFRRRSTSGSDRR